jgi:hypothetical protein
MNIIQNQRESTSKKINKKSTTLLKQVNKQATSDDTTLLKLLQQVNSNKNYLTVN